MNDEHLLENLGSQDVTKKTQLSQTDRAKLRDTSMASIVSP